MEEHIGIYDNYSGDIEYNQPVSSIDKFFFSKTIIIMLCTEGMARFNVRFNDYILSKNSFIVIGAGTPFYYTDKSEDFKVHIIAISDTLFDKLVQGVIRIYFQRLLHEQPLHEIDSIKMKMCCDIHGYLKNFIKEEDNFFKMQIIRNYLNILFYEACNIMLHEPGNNMRNKDRHKEEMASRFIRLVEQNVRSSRKVEYYASMMNITPKYLSVVIKETTGRNASAWIDDYTLAVARHLLRTSGMTIQQISYELGFATPSHFSKFIKDNTGLTPKGIRSRLEE